MYILGFFLSKCVYLFKNCLHFRTFFLKSPKHFFPFLSFQFERIVWMPYMIMDEQIIILFSKWCKTTIRLLYYKNPFQNYKKFWLSIQFYLKNKYFFNKIKYLQSLSRSSCVILKKKPQNNCFKYLIFVISLFWYFVSISRFFFLKFSVSSN